MPIGFKKIDPESACNFDPGAVLEAPVFVANLDDIASDRSGDRAGEVFIILASLPLGQFADAWVVVRMTEVRGPARVGLKSHSAAVEIPCFGRVSSLLAGKNSLFACAGNLPRKSL
jgi:hypothetical protein